MIKFSGVYIVDPNTDKPSVSLTNFAISVLVLLTAIGLHIAGKTATTSVALEYFFGSASLYFGRRLQSRSGDVGEKVSEEGK